MRIKRLLMLPVLSVLSSLVFAGDYTHSKIVKRNKAVALTVQQIAAAKMQGECLVGLKELNFKKKELFDPVAEWTTFRSSALLRRYSPCEVLVMMEIAQKKLRAPK